MDWQLCLGKKVVSEQLSMSISKSRAIELAVVSLTMGALPSLTPMLPGSPVVPAGMFSSFADFGTADSVTGRASPESVIGEPVPLYRIISGLLTGPSRLGGLVLPLGRLDDLNAQRVREFRGEGTGLRGRPEISEILGRYQH